MHTVIRGHWRVALPALGVAIVAGGSIALADSDVQKVSGRDPYAGCTIGAPGFSFPSGEDEPYLAANPRNDDNLIGVFQQDRWDNGGARGVAATVSNDGGSDWSTVTLPLDSCAGGLDYQRASDAWVSIGPDGTAYADALSFDQTTARSAVGATTSTDGGRTWHNAQAIIANDDINLFNDKSSITADPVHAGVAYAVWDHLNVADNNQPAYFARTVDGGRTWSTPRAITSAAKNVGTIGNIVVVDPRSDTLYDGFDNFTFHPNGSVATARESIIKSTDGGATWTAPIAIAADEDIGSFDPLTGAILRTGSGLPDVAIDPRTGELYVVWEDARFSGGKYDEVALSTSRDGGTTWSAPERVNKPTGSQAVTPMVAVNQDGVVGVSYFDFRTLPTSDPATLPTSYWLTTSPRGAASFKHEDAIIHTPFDLLTAPWALGYFVGDYGALATSGDDFLSYFVQATGTETRGSDPDNRSDVYFRSLEPDNSDQNVASDASPAFSWTPAGSAPQAPRPRRMY